MDCIQFAAEIDIIPVESRAEYQRQLEKLAEFIKIFKPSLKGMEGDYKEDEEMLTVTKYLIYDDFRIASEFESTGVKKLISLFNAFKKFMNGGIVFIDELDANLHDVYLCRLLDYFCAYGKGRLCLQRIIWRQWRCLANESTRSTFIRSMRNYFLETKRKLFSNQSVPKRYDRKFSV